MTWSNHTQKIFTIIIYDSKYRGTILDYPFVILSHIAKVSSLTLRLWNGLPTSTKSSPSLNIFKTRLHSGTKASHLQQHHLSDRPSCPHCNDPCESPSHYFMHCPLYNIHRQQLVDSLNELNIEFTIQTILYGGETSDYNQNVKLFRAVHSFIKRSKRFDNNIVI
jgi:hypothetical protein